MNAAKTAVAAMIVIAAMLGAAALTEGADAAGNGLDPVTVDSPEVVTGTLDLGGKDVTFTGNGSYTLAAGAILAMDGETVLHGNGEVIVFEAGSSVSIMGTSMEVPFGDVVELLGTMGWRIAMAQLGTISAEIDVDDKSTVTSGGMEMTGGPGKELSITGSVSETASGLDISLNVPHITMGPGGSFQGLSVVSLDLRDVVFDATIGLGETVSVGGKDGGMAILSAGSASAVLETVIGETAMTVFESSVNQKIAFSVGIEGNAVMIDIEHSADVVELGIGAEGADAPAVTATVKNPRTAASVGIEGGSVTISGKSDYAEFSADSVIADFGGATLRIDGIDERVNASFPMSFESGMPADLELRSVDSVSSVTLTADGMSFDAKGIKGESSYVDGTASSKVAIASMEMDGTLPLMDGVAHYTATDIEVSFSVDPADPSEVTYKATIGSIKGTGADSTVDASGIEVVPIETGTKTIIRDMTVHEGVRSPSVKSVDTVSTVTVIVETDESYTGSNTVETVITMYDGSKATIKSVLQGDRYKVEVRNLPADLEYILEAEDDMDITIIDSHVMELVVYDGATVNGSVRLAEGAAVYFQSGNGICNDGVGGIVEVVLSDTAVVSGRIVPADGYASIPAWTDGCEYTVAADGRSAVLVDTEGYVMFEAVGEKVNVTANGRTHQAEVGALVGIDDPEDVPAGMVFAGWYDGCRLFPSAYEYVPSEGKDVTLTPLWMNASWKATVSGNVLVIDATGADSFCISYKDAVRMERLLDVNPGVDIVQVVTDRVSALYDAHSLRGGETYLFYLISAPHTDGTTAFRTEWLPVQDMDGYELSAIGATGIGLTVPVPAGGSPESMRLYGITHYGLVGTVACDDIVDNSDGSCTLYFPGDDGIFEGYRVGEPAGPGSDDNGKSDLLMYAAIGAVIAVIAVAAILIVRKRP